MRNNQTSKMTALAMAATFTLAACGGGGGSSTPATPAVPASSSTAATSGVPPQTSVAAATYTAGSFQATAFALLNNYRNAVGVGLLAQDPVLDQSSQAHSLYTFSNLSTGVMTSLSHDEVVGNANYYADTPLLRAQKAGAPAAEWIGENIAAGTKQATDAAAAQDCIGQALASVYHLADLLANQQTVGYGYMPGTTAYPLYTCTTDFGISTGVVGAPGPNSFSYIGGQQIATNVVVHSPYTSEAGVALAMRAESPNPAPDLPAPGRPILVRVNSENMDILTVSQFTVADSTGAAVAGRILVPTSAKAGSTAATVADPNSILANGTAVFLPLAPLKANTTYTVTFSGTRSGSALSTPPWSFTTAAS
ncbi:CAP domain-containing protein [Caballeronia mineralivorans]|uniref:CAP domain-containing protein n=1 Tax=Caballeronia mineralivorans TaxID=2010198 RepID=UPI002AFEE265|nr:CAP domain-containing protein [Caballeronia mineralivorans]MEA3099454.1 hypothetical protein [Caballeronia mineralivorans]